MHYINLACLLALPAALIPRVFAQDHFNRSSKRGLIYIPPSDGNTKDAYHWAQDGSDLTWYYNYSPYPTPFFSNVTTTFPFIPMFFSPTNSPHFGDTITNLTKAGASFTHILSFNEPDGSTGTGGSNIKPSDAAAAYISELIPLRKSLNVKLGAPAVTGSPQGLTWLSSFYDACDGACTTDFMSVHWYGPFDGLVGHIETRRKAYPNATMWVTEYAEPNVALNETQSFFNSSTEWMDQQDDVERYSYFGSFRSDVSNVGKDVAMLDSKGRLTDIGSWYLGGTATGVDPNAGGRTEVGGWMLVGVVMSAIWLVL